MSISLPSPCQPTKLCHGLLCFYCALLLIFSATAQDVKPAATPAELQQRLTELLSQPKYAGALWGVKVVSLDSGTTLFEHNSQLLFTPASNCKLYTVALALDRLGEDYRIKTSLYAKSTISKDGTLNGDLLLYGRGDPTINARLHGGDINRALDPLVSALSNAGVRRITGDVVADESFFRGPPFGSGWMWEDLEYYYGAEISALTINDNTLQVSVKPGDRVGAPCRLALSLATNWITLSNRTETVEKNARRRIRFYRPLEENLIYVNGQMPIGDPGYSDDVTLHNPAGFFAVLLVDAIKRAGIRVEGKPRALTWLDRQEDPFVCTNMVEMGSIESPPLSEIAREVMKPSQNLYTDLLLANVGEKSRLAQSPPDETSEALGIRELNRFAAQVGIKKGDVVFEEGSGLSRDNLTTPNATIALLQFMDRHKCAPVYLNALPIAGVDGTLRNRMKGTAAEGNIRAKTGTLRWAVSLSGYVTSAAKEPLVFSIMLNRFYDPEAKTSARADVDAIAVMLAGFTGRSTN